MLFREIGSLGFGLAGPHETLRWLGGRWFGLPPFALATAAIFIEHHVGCVCLRSKYSQQLHYIHEKTRLAPTEFVFLAVEIGVLK